MQAPGGFSGTLRGAPLRAHRARSSRAPRPRAPLRRCFPRTGDRCLKRRAAAGCEERENGGDELSFRSLSSPASERPGDPACAFLESLALTTPSALRGSHAFRPLARGHGSWQLHSRLAGTVTCLTPSRPRQHRALEVAHPSAPGAGPPSSGAIGGRGVRQRPGPVCVLATASATPRRRAQIPRLSSRPGPS